MFAVTGVIFFLLASLALGTGCISQQTRHGGQIDIAALLLRYDENNRKPSPLVEYVGRLPEVLIYPDGLFMVTDGNCTEGKPKSRWLAVHLSPTQLTNILAKLCSHEAFWTLENRYNLVRGYDLPACQVTLRIPGQREKRVGVVGWMENQYLDTEKPPQEFVDFVEALSSIRPEGLHVWDPGYVEVQFWDYGYAPGRSLKWPTKWPSLRSQLVHDKWDGKVMIFPSHLVRDLDAFLATGSDYSAVLIDGWKTTASYRWPIPGEQTSFK